METDPQHPTPETPQPDGKPSPVLIVFLIIPLVLLVAALAMVARETLNQQSDNPLADGTGYPSNISLINYQAPIIQLPDLEGNPVELDQFRGRPVFLNFWYTGCPPCVREMPTLGDFAAAQGDDGAVVLAVNFDDTTEIVRDFLSEQNIDPAPLILMDVEARYTRLYGVVQAPVTFVIDTEGIVQYKHIGELTEAKLEDYLAELQNDT